MAHLWSDRVKQATSTTGTGTWTLGSASSGFIGFGSISGAADGDTVFYKAEEGANWEVGLGTLGGSLTTLARTTVLASTNGGAAVNFTTGPTIVLTHPAAKSRLPKSTTFTASGTWNKDPAAQFVMVVCIGGGGGGGSGRRGANSSSRGGGAGGGVPSVNWALFRADELPASVSVTIGAGGAGGTAITTNDTDGNAGSAGGNSMFGAYLASVGGAGGTKGVASAFGTGAVVPLAGLYQYGLGSGPTSGASFSSGGTTGNANAAGTWPGTGGGGGMVTTGDTAVAGGNGAKGAQITGTTSIDSQSNAGGVATAGSAGSDVSQGFFLGCGNGGGGGGGGHAAAAGAGGAGGAGGGGGGGGGGSTNGNNSGAGGAGGRGEVRVLEW